MTNNNDNTIDNNLCATVRHDFRVRYHEDLAISDQEIMTIMKSESFKNTNDQDAFLLQAHENFKLRSDLAMGTADDMQKGVTVLIDENGNEVIFPDSDTPKYQIDSALGALVFSYVSFCYNATITADDLNAAHAILLSVGVQPTHIDQFIDLVTSSISIEDGGTDPEGAIV